ncbi:MAG: endonuclease/exonuclease/phosphatase family protein [Acetobacter sp.]|nr:endonuclease/exonuclease/phosphatase family protein [Bacteroides sp.]MCM1342135.1 endonuclease/exonuclease/phosphatase family protein [Acetobacter sp.]MCM1434354.1 endonuclease/exonuclease/phosphatase family protein [Clostridiales bacterium]
MKKILSVFLSALIAAAAFAGCSRVKEVTFSPELKSGDITVVSFNVAGPWGNLKQGTSSQRVKRFAVYMNAVKPDFIGTQEINAEWIEKLDALMSDYDSFGIQRGGDDNEKKSEMNAVFWKKDKYECIEKNTFWLSETPEKESKYNGAGCNRVCTYVILQDNETKQCYLHMNTHLDNASDEARVFGAKVIKDKINEIKNSSQNNFKIILTGDFNDIEGSNPYNTISEILTSCSTVAEDKKKMTYTDWGSITDDSGEPIDFVFTDAEPVDYMILDDISNGFVSDHYGVLATISY